MNDIMAERPFTGEQSKDAILWIRRLRSKQKSRVFKAYLDWKLGRVTDVTAEVNRLFELLKEAYNDE